MLITELLARNASTCGDQIALVERDPAAGSRRQISWRSFHQQANQFANALIARGLQPGERVAHLLMNSLEWLPAYFGILRSGAWVVPLNFRFEAEVLASCAAVARPKVLLFGEEFIERVEAARQQFDESVVLYLFLGPAHLRPRFAEDYHTFIDAADNHDPDIPVQLSDTAALYFTSGTTGVPKAVRLSHRNLEHACLSEYEHHRQTPEDCFLCIPPLYHTGAKMHWFGSLLAAGRAVILKGTKPHWILDAVSQEHATIVWLLVPWAHDILIAWERGEIDLDDYQLSQWRLMHIGAQPVPPNLIHGWQRLFPDQQYDTNYGLTESTGPGCVHLGIGNSNKIGAIGRPGFEWACRVVGVDGQELPVGERGELLVKGAGVMQEYYRNPEATAAALSDGWLHTGDIVERDADGFLWLVDRKKDLIITGGENVSPVEVEHFFMAHPAIQDIGVIGTPDRRLGELVTAVIQLKPGAELDAAGVAAFAEGLPRYKRPRIVHFAAVPRNATGKIEKPKLRQRYAVA